MGNFGEVSNLAVGEFGIDHQVKNSPIEVKVRTPMTKRLQIAKFELHQHQ